VHLVAIKRSDSLQNYIKKTAYHIIVASRW